MAAGFVGLLRMGLAIRRIVKRDHVDVVIGNSVRATLAALLVPQRVPIVGYVRELFHDSRVGALALSLIMRRCAVVIANSNATARTLPAGDARLRVVYNAIDRSAFDAVSVVDPYDAKSSIGVPVNKKILAVIGYLAPLKGQADLVRALAPLRDRGDWHLVVVGSALFQAGSSDTRKYAREVRSLVNDLGLSGKVTFLGERSDVAAVLRAVDVVLVPSWYESFSRVVVEGMMSGCAVVATNVGGPVELIRDGEDGLLVPPRSPDLWRGAICRLLDDEAFTQMLRKRAAEKAALMPDAAQYAAGVVDAAREALIGEAPA